ncbi:sperm axonemal maintenance protein CFAP97D1-like [Saccoglossus kowalevskii]
MHRSYQSILPCQSRILQQRWDRKYYDEHRVKVKEAQSMVDTKAPKTYVHLHLKLKKLQLEEERLAVVSVDSLNREKRQRELLRVTRENQEILKRIMAREPEYNHLKWQQDWQENEQFMDNIARYPRDWWEVDQREKEKEREKKRKEQQKEKKQGKNKQDKEENSAGEPQEEQDMEQEQQAVED